MKQSRSAREVKGVVEEGGATSHHVVFRTNWVSCASMTQEETLHGNNPSVLYHRQTASTVLLFVTSSGGSSRNCSCNSFK